MYVSSKHGETQDIEQGSVQQELNFTEEGSVEQEFNFTGEGSVQREFNFTEDASLSTYPLSSSHSSDEEEESEYIKNSNFKNDIRIWAIEKNISQAAFKDLISILNKRFVDILPSDPRTILQTPTQICLKSIDGGEYWHNGIIIPLTKILHNLEFVPENVYLNVNLDGLPIFKSSKFEFWPILANMHEIDDDPFIIGIYYGKGKPKNLNLFLEDFVNESITVLQQGVCVNGIKVNIKIRCFICDSPARAFIKGVCNFNGKHGCLKCTTVGNYSHNTHTVVFSSKISPPRTDEDFRELKYGAHHKIDSPLLKLPIDMVEQFPVSDSLHLIHLGIMKRLLTGWKDGNFFKLKTKWCARDIDHVNLFLDEVERFGPLPTFDAYPFENKLYLIKKMLRHGNKPLSQVAKRLSEQNINSKSLKTKCSYEKPFLSRLSDTEVLNFEHFIISCKERNKYFLSSTDDIIEVLNISINAKKINIQGKKLMGKMLVFEKPLRSSFLNIYKVCEISLEKIDIVLSPDDVNCKLVCIVHGGFLYFIPLLHTL
ncbi:uncharacterized protein LOC125053528 isoform X2 [Pieris napi]|uniref:uncharacterized protein LOC125053528 isoform X2 n=1 Tax=Pieris napi TaxID=78633 RepID=UPI001FBC00C6|nr:uncharacterized protein LOC125053528 isoform X2 [Pieris napi]